MKQLKRLLTFAMALCLLLTLGNPGAFAAEGETPVLTFGSNGITETVAGAGYTVSGSTLTITAAGTYTVTGSAAEGNIAVKKGVAGVTLILKDLTLASASTAPLACGKTSEVTVQAEGTVVLTDSEDPANETSTDAAVADAFEGAAIKVKSGAKLTLTGSGSLTADGSACKNGIKGGASATVTVDMDGSLTVKAANNGLAADGEVVVKKGTLDITAGNEGIKAEPDEGDADSKGEITVYGGSITVNAQSDGIQAAKLITISGGDFTILAQRDGIQSNGDLTISGGSFDIKTFGGYNASGFNESTMSCKGLKASATDEDVENATNKITVTGGSFKLNTRDDAVHSDGYIYVKGGTFDIYTGDDGMHADTELHLGTEAGAERDPDVRVNSSYEGLEAGNLYIYGGRYFVVTSDDGINAAGGTGDNFNPGGPGGGWNPWNPGGPGGGSTGDYSINISGGQVYVNANGDGLDSNGDLNLTGGLIEVWGQSNADNEPLDCDGTFTVNGATVFAAGSRGMGYPSPRNSQTYKNYTMTISSGKLVTVKNGSTVVYNTTAPKNAQFAFFSSPDMSTSWTCTAGTGSVSCANGSSWAHSWNEGVVTTAATTEAEGLTTYTCTVCGAVETETIPMLVTVPEGSGGDPGPVEPDEGFAVTFTTDAHSSLAVYATQDVAAEAILTVAAGSSGADVSRSSATGLPDSSGEGQVNFVVTVDDGYEIDAVTATEGTYKNIKEVSADTENGVYVYRVTKISAETAVSVTTGAVEPTEPSNPFEDVEEGKFFYDAVLWAVNREPQITNGTDATHFAPGAECTRGQVVTFLWRAKGCPEPASLLEGGAEQSEAEGVNPFADVTEGKFYYKAVLWAVENNITAGMDATHFGPGEPCTRGQVVTFLWRAAGKPEPVIPSEAKNPGANREDSSVAVLPQNDTRDNETPIIPFNPDGGDAECPFEDVVEGAYYYDAMLWAVANEVTNGTSATTFSPGATCTRGQVVTFLYRALAE